MFTIPFFQLPEPMEMIKKNHVIAGFNRGAQTYDSAASLQAEVAQRLATYFTQASANTVLEIGCGTGLLSQHILHYFKEATLLLTDVSPSMLHQCRLRLPAREKLYFDCIDGENISHLPSFDLITSSMALHWVHPVARNLEYIQQKLSPKGHFIFSLLTQNSFKEWQDMCNYFNYPVATPHFPTLSEITDSFPQLNYQVETIKKNYSSAQDFLRTLKALGATAPRSDYQKLSASKLRKLLHHFNHGIEITYEVVYGVLSA